MTGWRIAATSQAVRSEVQKNAPMGRSCWLKPSRYVGFHPFCQDRPLRLQGKKLPIATAKHLTWGSSSVESTYLLMDLLLLHLLTILGSAQSNRCKTIGSKIQRRTAVTKGMRSEKTITTIKWPVSFSLTQKHI